MKFRKIHRRTAIKSHDIFRMQTKQHGLLSIREHMNKLQASYVGSEILLQSQSLHPIGHFTTCCERIFRATDSFVKSSTFGSIQVFADKGLQLNSRNSLR